MTLDRVTSFSRIKNLRNACKHSVRVKVVGGISSCNGGKQEKKKKKLKDTTAFSSFLVC